MTKENPFTITFGKQPNTQITRYEDVDRIVSSFNAEKPVCQTFLIEGVRGSGKTVLMTTVARQFEEKKDWLVINLNSAMGLLSGLALRLEASCSGTSKIIGTGINVTAAGFGIGVNAEEKTTDSVGIIDGLFNKIVKDKKRVLITIDEALHDDNMRVFASQFQIFVRQDYPVFLIMTGLYENIYGIQNDPGLTFLLRSPKINIGPLSIFQIIKQYKDIFDMNDEDAKKLARFTKGYAFAFQALGVVYWEKRQNGMEAVLTAYDELLDDFVYKKIWSALSDNERRIVLSMTDDEIKTGDVCKELSMNPGTFSRYRDQLVHKGIIESKRYGYVSLVLPRFNRIVTNYVF